MLADELLSRLRDAGIRHDDPGLRQIRAWNTAVYARAGR